MALDYMAIASNGAFPTPTPTALQRAAYAVSYGLLSFVTEGIVNLFRGLSRLGLSNRMN